MLQVRALEGEVKAGKSARAALEGQLEEAQGAIRVRAWLPLAGITSDCSSCDLRCFKVWQLEGALGCTVFYWSGFFCWIAYARAAGVHHTKLCSSILLESLESDAPCPQAREEQAKKYRQWLGALLECTTKLAAGRAALTAAEVEVKAREGDLALLNEEVAAFMSKAR